LPDFLPVAWAIIAHGLGHQCPLRVHLLPTLWALPEEQEMARRNQSGRNGATFPRLWCSIPALLVQRRDTVVV